MGKIKTETTAEFLARGGAIKKVAAKPPAKTKVGRHQAGRVETPAIDATLLPMALRIKFGLR